MSDSGRQIGDCEHARTRTACPVCLAKQVVALTAVNARLVAECRNVMQDRQCAQRCDGPHADCICWYCRMGVVVKEAEEHA